MRVGGGERDLGPHCCPCLGLSLRTADQGRPPPLPHPAQVTSVQGPLAGACPHLSQQPQVDQPCEFPGTGRPPQPSDVQGGLAIHCPCLSGWVAVGGQARVGSAGSLSCWDRRGQAPARGAGTEAIRWEIKIYLALFIFLKCPSSPHYSHLSG